MTFRILALACALLPACLSAVPAHGRSPDSTSRTDTAHPEPGHAALTVGTPHAAKAARRKADAADPAAARILTLPGWGAVTVYAPPGAARGLALFASGDGGWNLGVRDMAREAARLGYWVAGFSTPTMLHMLDASGASCSDAAAQLRGLATQVRDAMGISAHYRPLLIGYSSGATVAYAALAQSNAADFSGAMTLGFCPDLIYHKPFCTKNGLTAHRQARPPHGFEFDSVPGVPAPWIVLQGDIDKVCEPVATRAFVAAVRNGHVVNLPHVGHGYGVPRNWMPQYLNGLVELRDAREPDANAAGLP